MRRLCTILGVVVAGGAMATPVFAAGGAGCPTGSPTARDGGKDFSGSASKSSTSSSTKTTLMSGLSLMWRPSSLSFPLVKNVVEEIFRQRTRQPRATDARKLALRHSSCSFWLGSSSKSI